MLILQRGIGDIVRINDDCLVVVTAIDYKTGIVRLGFEAPRKYEIHREEVYQKIQNAKR